MFLPFICFSVVEFRGVYENWSSPDAVYRIWTLRLSFQKALEVRMTYHSPRKSEVSSSKGDVAGSFSVAVDVVPGGRKIAVDDIVMKTLMLWE